MIWFDDEPPPGAKLEGQWQWDKQPVHSGKRSMVRTGAGMHQHSFTGATKPLYINAGDRLFTYVYLDPKNPPKSIMLQFHDGTWEHRAYWGEDKCVLAGTPNGPQHFLAGPLPPTGKWVRLEIDADKLNLQPDTLVTGMAFTQFDGTAYYDQPGISSVFPADDRHLTSVRLWEPRAKANGKLPADVKTALKVAPDKRSPEQKTKILHHYLRNVYAPTRRPLRRSKKTSARSPRSSRRPRTRFRTR